jgi:hypothetical protein
VYEQAQQWAGEIGIAWHHYEVCWSGSIYGFAQVVMTSCERAIELESNVGDYHYSRGLARALTGDYAGAIKDLQFAVERWEDEGEEGERLDEFQEWITELETGQNPFSDELLETLR